MKKKLFIGLISSFMVLGLASCKDGLTPYIGENGNWWIGEEDTGTPATGPAGENGQDGHDGHDGTNGHDGHNGQDGKSITVVSVEKTKTEGLVDTYTITFSDGTKTTFTVTNGESSVIESIELTESSGLVDTYTITFTNGATKVFTVTNGANGSNGENGKDLTITSIELESSEGLIDTYVINYSDGSEFEFVVSNGADGLTPFIGDNGNWWIGEEDTGVLADWEKANDIPLTPYSDGLRYEVRTINGKSGFSVIGWSIDGFEESLIAKYGEEEYKILFEDDNFSNAHLVIPNYIGTVPVIGISFNVHALNFGKVTLSNQTVSLSEYCFAGCNNLKEIDFHDCKINAIPTQCFAGTSLTNVTLPNTVTHIFARTFDGTFITSINLDNIKYIGEKAFDDSYFEFVYLNKDVEYVGDEAFVDTFVYFEGDEIPTKWDFRQYDVFALRTGVKSNGEYLYSINNYEVTIYQYLGNDEKLIIPEEIEGYPITTIGAGFNSFIYNADNYEDMTESEIYHSMKELDGYVKEVVIGNNVKKIENYALNNTNMFAYIEDSVEEVYFVFEDSFIGLPTLGDADFMPKSLIAVEDTSKTKFIYNDQIIPIEDVITFDDELAGIIFGDIQYDDIVFQDEMYFVRVNGGYELLTYHNNFVDMDAIPNYINLLPVVSIGKYSIYNVEIGKLIIGDNVNKIKSSSIVMSGKLFIPHTVSIINANAIHINDGFAIYTDASAKLDEWDSNWVNYQQVVNYSYSKESFINL